MSWLYVTEPGARLIKRGGCYVIQRENETICEVPAGLVEGAVIIDTVQVSSQVIVDFLHNNVPLTWLSTTGKFFGRLESTQNQDVMRQKAQFDLQENDPFRVALSKRIVFGKIYNQMTILRRYQRTAQLPNMDDVLKQMRLIANKIDRDKEIEAIMGHEGAIARLYFGQLGKIVPKEFAFERRSRRPPEDAFNAMLSFGYTLLIYDFYTALTNLGLHPYVGFLHSLRNGHPALASDLMEPWRPAVVDALCLSLISHHEIKPEHFTEKDPETGGVYLDRVGRRIFIRAYEKKMQGVNKYFKGEYSWRYSVGMECDSFRQALEHKDLSLLRPFIIR